MDATRVFRYRVYCPYCEDNQMYDTSIQLDLEHAYYYYIESGQSLFAVVDALSLEYGCDIDMEELTPNEEIDLYKAIKGR